MLRESLAGTQPSRSEAGRFQGPATTGAMGERHPWLLRGRAVDPLATQASLTRRDPRHSFGAVGYGVVAISPTDGSAGEELGPIVARELGFRLVNEQIVAQAAREAGVTAEVVADVERRKSFWPACSKGWREAGPGGAAGVSGFPRSPRIRARP